MPSKKYLQPMQL